MITLIDFGFCLFTTPLMLVVRPIKESAMNIRKWIFAPIVIAALCLGFAATYYPPNAQAASVIETKIDGDFEGWEGETVVKLMNGQVWIQTEYYYEYHYAYMPDVLIYQSGGGWKMKVEGVGKAVGVEQLR